MIIVTLFGKSHFKVKRKQKTVPKPIGHIFQKLCYEKTCWSMVWLVVKIKHNKRQCVQSYGRKLRISFVQLNPIFTENAHRFENAMEIEHEWKRMHMFIRQKCRLSVYTWKRRLKGDVSRIDCYSFAPART